MHDRGTGNDPQVQALEFAQRLELGLKPVQQVGHRKGAGAGFHHAGFGRFNVNHEAHFLPEIFHHRPHLRRIAFHHQPALRAGTLHARIEGTIGGKLESEEWVWSRRASK